MGEYALYPNVPACPDMDEVSTMFPPDCVVLPAPPPPVGQHVRQELLNDVHGASEVVHLREAAEVIGGQIVERERHGVPRAVEQHVVGGPGGGGDDADAPVAVAVAPRVARGCTARRTAFSRAPRSPSTSTDRVRTIPPSRLFRGPPPRRRDFLRLRQLRPSFRAPPGLRDGSIRLSRASRATEKSDAAACCRPSLTTAPLPQLLLHTAASPPPVVPFASCCVVVMGSSSLALCAANDGSRKWRFRRTSIARLGTDKTATKGTAAASRRRAGRECEYPRG